MILSVKTYCLVLFFAVSTFCLDNNKRDALMVQYLETNLKLQGKAEIVFLLDRSGSVGAADFETELGFVESFLTHIVVDVNASRVAVISYSDTATRHIDYLKEPKTKCFLAQEMHDVEYKDSGATNIVAAFEEARKVFENARPNVNKVIVFISDGLATKGGDAANIATKLKAEGVEIFCFGVGRFLQTELERLASSLQHVYTCSGFNEFKRLARKIRGDPHESSWSGQTSQPNCDHLCDSLYKGDPNDPGCCDHDAKCSCALKSGVHSCVCKPGFYGLSGTAGDCRACPRGTYKSKLEPSSTCTPCPLGSTTAETASTKLSDCYCRDGYTGNPSNGITCDLINCPRLQPPTNGYIIEPCNTVYGSTCHFICDDGYDFVDPSSDIRTCQSNGEWTGKTTVCREIRCNPLRPPTFGRMSCDQKPFTVGKKCRFQCERGYMIEGSDLRECTSSKKWTGKETHCIQNVCELPPRLVHGKIYSCVENQKPKYKDICMYSCNSGFYLKGARYLRCTEDGILVDEYGHRTRPECEDRTRPEVFCPNDIRVKTDKGKNTALVKWTEPLATDNSGYTPKLILNPSYVKQNHPFPIGKTILQYRAVDQAGLDSSCSFYVDVRDDEPPVIVKCPQKIELSTNEYSIPVYWEEPEFQDNSNRPVRIIYRSYNSGNLFGQGTRSVIYIGEDESGNRATCEFDVIISRSECKYYPPPNNGALACDDRHFGEACQVYCEEQYDFQWIPAEYYICNQQAQWETLFPSNAHIPWPDCSRIIIPGAVHKMVGFYYKGDCRDPAVQRYIKKLFLSHISSRIKHAELCLKDGTCSIDTVKVSCGEITERRKRDIWQDKEKEQLELEFEITINADQQFNDTQALMQDFLEILNNLQWDFAEDINIATTTYSPVEFILEQKSETLVPNEERTTLLCKAGSILKEEQCVLCSTGTFYDTSIKECTDCPVGSYQELEGQLQCNKCPEGTSTEQSKTKNETLCKGICSLGTYSVTGLETCLACSIGMFQSSSGMTSCFSCPNGTTTANIGAISVENCKDLCPPGTFSSNRLEPCEPCPFHHYQPLPGMLECIECPEQLLTAEKGAIQVKECIDLDPCLIYGSCQNNGSCVGRDRNAKCECYQGFEGDHCEKDVDECSSSPCVNGGNCVNVEGSFFCECLDGFVGVLCDVEIDECASSPCQNEGTCIDEVNGYKCVCTTNFEGDNCEFKRELCFRDVVCLNDGACMIGENDNSSFCICQPGFAGIDCSQNLDECVNVTCKNSGSCIDGINSFTCACSPGYTGKFCEINIDECENNLCHSGSTCQDLINVYKCICLPGWNGTYCDNKLDSDFILMFPDSTATIGNMASMTLNSPLTDATVSLWVQTNDTERSGTPLSYAVATTKNFDADGTVVDNALTISDCSEIKIYVNNEPVMTDLQVADGQWHHLAFTWSSESGIWALYKDGELKNEGQNLRPHEVILGGGNMIIGQEQDTVGGGFSPTETFTGNVTRVNIWNSYFSKNNITRLCNMDDEQPNKVLAWPDFLHGLKGNVHIIKNSKPIINKTNF